MNLVEQIAREIPGARVCVCCDLTKKFEKIERGLAGTVLERLKANPNVEKGEYCVAIELPEIEEEAPAVQSVAPSHGYGRAAGGHVDARRGKMRDSAGRKPSGRVCRQP